MRVYHLRVNGDQVQVAAPEHWTLLEVLRYQLHLTGSKQGCDKGDCGACTVLIDGEPELACLVLPATVEGKDILTIEGLAAAHLSDGIQGANCASGSHAAHPIQESFDAKGALQCGFCQPGIMLSAKSLLDKNANPNRQEIKGSISGNLCRCTGYKQIYDAIEDAGQQLRGEEEQV